MTCSTAATSRDQRRRLGGAQVGQVDQPHRRHLPDGRVHVARQRQVDQRQPRAAGRPAATQQLGVDQRVRRRGRQEGEVRRGQLGRQLGQVHDRGTGGGEPVGVPAGAVAHGHPRTEGDAAVDHRRRHLPGADQQQPAAGQVAGHRVDGRGRDRPAGGGDAGAPVRAAGGADRRVEQPIQRDVAARLPARLGRGSDLAGHLGLAEHERLHAGGDPQQVPGGGVARVRRRRRGHRRLRDAAVGGERRCQGGQVRLAGPAGVELDPLAGRQHGHRRGAGGGPQPGDPLGQLGATERQPLQQVERRLAASDRDAAQPGHFWLSASVSRVSAAVRFAPNGALAR